MFKGFFNRMMFGKSDKPDLTKEDMAQNRYQLFFEILGVKYWDLVKLNLLILLFALPLIIWTIMSTNAVSGMIAEMGTDPEAALSGVAFYYFLGLIPCLAILGPPLAGVHYIIRNYTQDRHAWMWSDFIEHAKSNWKQSVGYMLIIALSLNLVNFTLMLYNNMIQFDGNAVMIIMRGVLIVFYVFFLLSSMYVFPMMVTYDLKIKHLLRNAFIFTLSRLHFTLLFWLLILLPAIILLWVYMATAWPYALLILILYYGLFGAAFGIYITHSYTNPTFERYMKVEDTDETDAEPAQD